MTTAVQDEVALHSSAPPHIGPEWVHQQSPKSAQLQTNVDIDYDRLLSSIEHSIMIDRDRAMAEISPQELLIRSNPGVFSMERELTRDLTNPREMYNILAYKTKSTEDLAIRFKQELSKSFNAPGVLPKLSRTVSFNEIRRNANQFERLGNKPLQKTQSLQTADKKFDASALTRHSTFSEDVRKIHEEDKENLGTINLPNITRNTNSTAVLREEKENKSSTQQTNGLPDLSDSPCKSINKSVKSKSRLQRKLSASDSKLDKWFSEMPNEVFDKAQRAIMEESIKDKLQRYQDDRGKKIQLDNNHVHVCVGSRVRKLPNTFLELHVDTFGKHLHSDKDDKMNKYKLQQKSMLKLKMREIETLEKKERSHDDLEMMARLALQPKSLTSLALTRTKPPQTVKQMQPDVIRIPTDPGGLKTVNINDNVDIEFDIKHKYRLSGGVTEARGKWEDYVDGEVEQGRVHRAPSPPSSAIFADNEIETHASTLDRETTKATIVTLSLKKDIPMKRKPFHLEKTLLNANCHPEKVETFSAKDRELTNPLIDTESTLNVEKEPSFTSVVGESKIDKIVTKIPTARSNRTSESKSSSSSIQSASRANKSVLKRFNKLEVFAESGKQPELKMTRKSYHGQKLKEYKESREDMPIPPAVKLDLKHIPHHPRTCLKEDGELVRNEVRMQDVVFRFEPGEVFITSKNSKKANHAYNNRSSERARIIYGKVLQGRDEKRDPLFRGRDDMREIQSSRTHGSTTMDGFRSERYRYENRTMDGSFPSYSARDIDGTLTNTFIKISKSALTEEARGLSNSLTKAPIAHVNDSGVFVRDIAIETDVIGSEPNTPRQHLEPINTANDRSHSGLSSFIVDNNDGESLDSGQNNRNDVGT